MQGREAGGVRQIDVVACCDRGFDVTEPSVQRCVVEVGPVVAIESRSHDGHTDTPNSRHTLQRRIPLRAVQHF